MLRHALLISGGGTTAEAIALATNEGGPLHGLIKIVLVISSRSDAGGINKLKNTGVLPKEDVIVIRKKDFAAEEAFGDAIIDAFTKRGVESYSQNGWLPHTPKNVIRIYPVGTNQHPGPLCPGFTDFGGDGMYGSRVTFARLLFVRLTGRNYWTAAVAHRVAPDVDKGPVVGWTEVPIEKNDDVDTLKARLLPREHELQIEVLRKLALGELKEIATPELVLEHEQLIWMNCCKIAKIMYPKG